MGVVVPIKYKQIDPETGEEQNQIIETEVKILNDGMLFGEKGMIENRERAATIICKEESHFLTLDRDSFIKILGRYEENKVFSNMTLLQSIQIFCQWSQNLLKWL